MPTKLSSTTADSIAATMPPVLGNGMTLPSHLYLTKITEAAIESNQLKIRSINNESDIFFIGSGKNEIVSASYTLETEPSSKYKMVFCWVNAYTRSMRFRCAIGCKNEEGNAIYVKKVFSVRKGGGELDIKELIDSVLKEAPTLFANLLSDLEALSFVTKSREEVADFLGRLFFDKNLITPHQASSIQKWTTDDFKDVSVWKVSDMYEMLSLVSFTFHPRFWLEAHAEIHSFITDSFDVSNPMEFTASVLGALPKTEIAEIKTESIVDLVDESIVEDGEIEEDSIVYTETTEEEVKDETEVVPDDIKFVFNPAFDNDSSNDDCFRVEEKPAVENVSEEEKYETEETEISEEIFEEEEEEEELLDDSNKTDNFNFEW
jgi:hypothetical protein